MLQDRFGGDEVALQRMLEHLEPIRDRVLAEARISTGSVVVDVGCGDGLLAFGALRLVGGTGRVVFVDVSEELLDRCRETASELGVVERCRFVKARAETLDEIADGSVDAVMTRSVLIYVEDKAGAFASFHRVLRSEGRISLFEPLNRRYVELNKGRLFGYDINPVRDIVEKLKPAFRDANPPDGPMMGFDETDLLRLAEESGFASIRVTVELTSSDRDPFTVPWSELMKIRPNPHAPTFGEAIKQCLSPAEAARLQAHLRPLIDDPSVSGRFRNAAAYVTAVRRPN